MRYLTLLISFVCAGLFYWLLSTPQSVSGNTLPPLGSFLNPFSGFWANAEPVSKYKSGKKERVDLPGLKGPVEVLFDDMQVPHIFAEHEMDAYRVQGYVTARHRLWQMDISARQTEGRLSEVLGDVTVPLDKAKRRRGLGKAAEDDWEAYRKNDFTRQMFEAYADGVNAWVAEMNEAKYPMEYKLLNYQPENWTPLRSCMVIEGMIDALNQRDFDLASSNALGLLGRDTFDYLFPEWYPKAVPIVPDTGQWDGDRAMGAGARPGLRYSRNEIPERLSPSSLPALNGSNNWALSGEKTASGAPLLCNDTHLPLRLPHVWYQVHIHLPDRNVYGIIVPGVPGIVIGFNENIAWGFTNVAQEVGDWYKIKWTDAAKSSYLLDGKPEEVEYRVEEIKIRGKEPLLDTVRYTHWGPVVYEDPENPLVDYAYKYSTHDPPGQDDLEKYFSINKAETFNDYRHAIRGLDCLSQNVAFASRKGDIAITVQGKFPIREVEQGRFLQEGSSLSNDWKGYVPNDELPCLHNPARGFVFSANQHSTPPSYPYYYKGRFDDSRSRRIYQRLVNMQGATVDSMKSIQLDNHSPRSYDMLQAMLPLVDIESLSEKERQIYRSLESWDASYKRNTALPSMFDIWRDTVYNFTWDELERERLEGLSLLYPSYWRTTSLMIEDPESIFFDNLATSERETAGDVITHCFKAMCEELGSMEEEALEWSTFKGFAIMHISRQAAFSRMDVITDGTRHTPNATDGNHGPTFRMIVSLEDQPRAWGIYPGGQSGNPGSPFFDNLVDDWASGNYRELNFWKDAEPEGKALTGHIEFNPKN